MITSEPHQLHIRIRELRQRKELTQEELAGELGLSRQSVNAMEAGRCLPSLPVALQLATFFEVPLQQIFLHPNNSLPVTPRKEEVMNRLIPWSPLHDMREMLDELMDESSSWPTPIAMTAPAVNVSQNEKDVMIEMRLPGFERENLTIEVGDSYITINGDAKQKQEQEDKQFFRREFSQQSFSRTISLPAPVETDQAKAEMKHGVLHVTLPKLVEEKPKTKRLEIND